LRIAGDPLVSHRGLVGLAVGGVGFAEPVVGLEGDGFFGIGGQQRLEAGDGFLELLFRYFDFGLEQLRCRPAMLSPCP